MRGITIAQEPSARLRLNSWQLCDIPGNPSHAKERSLALQQFVIVVQVRATFCPITPCIYPTATIFVQTIASTPRVSPRKPNLITLNIP